MMLPCLPGLVAAYGSDNAEELATAYESAVQAMTCGKMDRFPCQKTRLALIQAMLDEGHRNGFHADRLTRAALFAVASR